MVMEIRVDNAAPAIPSCLIRTRFRPMVSAARINSRNRLNLYYLEFRMMLWFMEVIRFTNLDNPINMKTIIPSL